MNALIAVILAVLLVGCAEPPNGGPIPGRPCTEIGGCGIDFAVPDPTTTPGPTARIIDEP